MSFSEASSYIVFEKESQYTCSFQCLLSESLLFSEVPSPQLLETAMRP